MERPFFYQQAEYVVSCAIRDPRLTDSERGHLWLVQLLLEGKVPVEAATTKPLSRYAVQPGKVFGLSSKDRDKVKIVRLIENDVVFQHLDTGKINVMPINRLLDQWNKTGVREISFLDEIIRTIKSVIGPLLGTFLTAALLSWLMNQLNK